MEKLWYLASPYSHADAWVREMRFQAISRVAGRLRVERGIATFCPIAHSHPISKELIGVDPTDHDFWLGWDEPFERLCDGLIVCMLPGWRESKGIAQEVPLFKTAQKKVEYFGPMPPSEPLFTPAEWAMLEAGRL